MKQPHLNGAERTEPPFQTEAAAFLRSWEGRFPPEADPPLADSPPRPARQTHLKWSCRATLKSKASPLSPKPMPMKALRPDQESQQQLAQPPEGKIPRDPGNSLPSFANAAPCMPGLRGESPASHWEKGLRLCRLIGLLNLSKECQPPYQSLPQRKLFS